MSDEISYTNEMMEDVRVVIHVRILDRLAARVASQRQRPDTQEDDALSPVTSHNPSSRLGLLRLAERSNQSSPAIARAS